MHSEVKKQRKHPLILAGAIGLVVVVSIVIMGFVYRNIDISVSNGGFIHITPASLWSSVFESGASCKLGYQPKDGRAGTIALWQDYADRPIIVTPSADDKTLLCLYNYDVDLRLLKIDPSKSPQPFPAKSDLEAIVCSSPWQINVGTINDWQEVLDYLKKLPSDDFKRQSVPIFDLGIFRLHVSPKSIQQRIEEQIKLMNQFGATQWPVPNH